MWSSPDLIYDATEKIIAEGFQNISTASVSRFSLIFAKDTQENVSTKYVCLSVSLIPLF